MLSENTSAHMFLSPRSDEADDGARERGAEPEHSPGQHAETVRGREEQDRRQTSQREAGAAAAEEEGGRFKLEAWVFTQCWQNVVCNSSVNLLLTAPGKPGRNREYDELHLQGNLCAPL